MKDDVIEKLKSLVVYQAAGWLEAKGDFPPFGGVLQMNGEPALTTSDPGPVPQMIGMLTAGFNMHAKQGKIVGAALCYHWKNEIASPGKPMPTIFCHAEKTDGTFEQIVVPYKKRFLRGYQYGAPIPVPNAEQMIFNAMIEGTEQSLGGDSENRAADGTVSGAPQG